MSTIASPIVSSTADMMSAVPSDLFNGISAAPDTSGGDDAADEFGDEAIDIPDTPIDDAPAELADEPPPADEAPAEPEGADVDKVKADAAATPEELPDGVRKGKDRKGKDGYFLEENRYQTFHGNHKIVQQGAELIGEPLTPEAIKLRNEAYLGQERLFSNLNSGDPAAQSDVLNFIINEMNGARTNGEVGVDPTVPFAEAVYNTLRTKAPDAYANLRMLGARELIGEMFDTAATAGDRDLYSSAQRFAMQLANVPPKPAGMSDEDYALNVRDAVGRAGIRFHTLQEMHGLVKTEDPLTAAQKRIAELESRVNNRSETGTAAQYDTWARDNIKAVNTSVIDDAVKPSLATVEAGWKDFPDDYKRLVLDPLHREVVAAVKADPVLDQQVKDLQVRARRATSEQVRQQLGTQIKQLIVNRARLAVDAKKAPIVKFAADWLKGRSDQTHERKANAQNRTAPKGPSAPVRTSTMPDVGFKDGIYDPKTAMKQMQALFR